MGILRLSFVVALCVPGRVIVQSCQGREPQCLVFVILHTPQGWKRDTRAGNTAEQSEEYISS